MHRYLLLILFSKDPAPIAAGDQSQASTIWYAPVQPLLYRKEHCPDEKLLMYPYSNLPMAFFTLLSPQHGVIFCSVAPA